MKTDARRAQNRVYDAKREAEQPWRAWYRTPEWRAIRSARFRIEPACRFCTQMGKHTDAKHVDHVEPHKGDRTRFFSLANTQALCEVHHNSTKQRMERGRVVQAIGEDGWPVG